MDIRKAGYMAGNEGRMVGNCDRSASKEILSECVEEVDVGQRHIGQHTLSAS